jgi:hypothetical protein
MKSIILSVISLSLFVIAGFIEKEQAKTKEYKIYQDTDVTRFFNRTQGWIASDGALTVALNDGSSLWLMGDSHFNDFDPKTGTVPCLFQVRNCVLLQPRNDWNWLHTTTFIGNGPGSRSYFKFKPSDEYFSWPGGGVQIGDTIYVYSSNLKKTGPGMWGFGPGGPDMWAKIKYPEMKVAGYSPLQDFGGIGFGFSMVKDAAAGYVYVYGDKMFKTAGKLYVARFPISNPNAPWTFWDGKTWNSDVSKVAPIADGLSYGLNVCKVKNKYLVFGTALSVDCDQGKDIYVACADSPLGPFSKAKTIYTIPDRVNGHSPFFYGVCGHPEFLNKKDELLVTYDINGYGKCVVDCVNGRSDPNIYRPRGIRVPLKLIDPSL